MSEVREIQLGQFVVTSGKVMVSDPCYKVGEWCQAQLDNVKNGSWVAYVKQLKYYDGYSNSELIVHKFNEVIDNDNWEEVEATIGVDSGQCGIYDLSSYRNDSIIGDIKNRLHFDLEKEEYGVKFYALNCDLTDGEYRGGILDCGGVVSSSGYGDGGYVLYVNKNDESQIIGMKVVFIGDEDNEEEFDLDFLFEEEE